MAVDATESNGYEPDHVQGRDAQWTRYRQRQLELALAGRIIESARYAHLAAMAIGSSLMLSSRPEPVCC